LPEIRLQGSGISGKRWVAHLCGIDEVWRGDLDGNGKSDYVISSLGPYFNGRTTPPFSLSILLMDEGGLPVPFFTTVFHGENGMAVKNLVDLDHDGRAELLISTYDELASDPLAGTFSSGHWVTQLYRFRSLRAEEFSGTLGGMHFPFVHAWTYADHDPKRTPQPITDPILREHGTGTKADWQTVIRGRKESQLIINPVAGCNSIGDSLETIVYERSSRREIAFANLWTSASEKLMAAIRRDGASVQLGGIDKRKDETACSVKLIWATAKSSK
jgi:hypothetical protein